MVSILTPLFDLFSNQKDQEKDSSITVDTSPGKDFYSPTAAEWVHKLIYLFPNRLEKKKEDEAHLIR